MIWNRPGGLNWSVNREGFAGEVWELWSYTLNLPRFTFSKYANSTTWILSSSPFIVCRVCRFATGSMSGTLCEKKRTALRYGPFIFLLFFEWQRRSLGLSFITTLCTWPSGLCLLLPWFRRDTSTYKDFFRKKWKSFFFFFNLKALSIMFVVNGLENKVRSWWLE